MTPPGTPAPGRWAGAASHRPNRVVEDPPSKEKGGSLLPRRMPAGA